MENASKALIIAGAILLAILIITLGIVIFQQASEVVDKNAMSELQVTQFNEKFISYTGDNIRGATVNSLISRIVQNNVSNQSDTSQQVKIYVSSGNWIGTKPATTTGTVITEVSNAGRAQTGKTYDVSYTTNSKTGLIDVITIADPEEKE